MREKKTETKAKKSTAKKADVKVKTPKKAKEVKEEKVVVKKESKENEKGKSILNLKEQKCYKVLCKVIRVLVKIVRVLLMICVPFIFLLMIFVPFIFKNFVVNANIIKFGDASLIVRDSGVSIKIGEDVEVIDCSAQEADRIMAFFADNSKAAIITVAELTLLLFGVIIVMNIYVLSYIEKIFNNFINEKTPFIKENADHILVIAILLAAMGFISFCVDVANILPIQLLSISLVEILIVFVLYFVFKYGAEMQKKVNTKICE